MTGKDRDPHIPRACFVDAHVHISDAAGLAGAAQAGIAAIRDAGSAAGAGLAARSGAAGGVVVRSAGWALYREGGYGSRLGRPAGAADMEARILELHHAGADIIKVIASGLVSLKRPGEVTPGGLGRDELRAAVQAAAGRGMSVMAHANGPDAIGAAIEAGVRSIEHGFFMTDGLLERMRERGTFWVPTIGALARAADASAAGSDARAFVVATIRAHLDMVGRAYRLGVPLAVGTDCVLPDAHYRERYRRELAYFREAGIPQAEVDRIAVENGERLLGA